MKEIFPTIAVPFTLGNLIQKESAVTTHLEVTSLKIMANTAAALILNPAIDDCQSYSFGTENHKAIVSPPHQNTISAEVMGNQVGADLVSEMVIDCDSNLVLTESHNQARNEDEIKFAKDFKCLHDPSSHSVASDKSSPCREESATSRTNCSEKDSPITKGDDNIHGNKSSLTEPHAEIEPVQNKVSVGMEIESEDGNASDGCDPKPTAEMTEKQTCRTSCQNALELSGGGPLWGFSSICGRRQEMEDAVAVKPQLFQVPSQMLMDDHVSENTKYSPVHFFGVYDGHGGYQVCLEILPVNYTTCLYRRS